jgi:hypothetical protein
VFQSELPKRFDRMHVIPAGVTPPDSASSAQLATAKLREDCVEVSPPGIAGDTTGEQDVELTAKSRN